jgi:hypothetical protein
LSTLKQALADHPRVKRSVLWHVADGINHAIQKIVLFAFYYVPVTLAFLNPFLRKSDIRQVHAGASSFNNGRYAIYVLWQPTGTIPWYVRDMLEELRRQNVNTIVVLNHQPSAEQLAVLKDLCARTLVRGNKGLDFGAYRDAVLDLICHAEHVSRLLLLNDSVYVVRNGLAELISALLSDDCPVVAAYECWERRYHVQSFCIAVAGSVLYDARVQRFWQQYRPIAIRRWRIDRGEVKLSEILRQVAPRFKVIYGVKEMVDALLAERDWASVLRYREYLPRPLRHLFPQDIALALLQQTSPSEQELLLRRLKERLSDLLMLRAQAHTGAFLFPKFLGSPFLKRDIVFRELYTLYEVQRMLDDLGWDEYSQWITDEIRQRGTAAHLTGLTRRRHQLGLTA